MKQDIVKLTQFHRYFPQKVNTSARSQDKLTVHSLNFFTLLCFSSMKNFFFKALQAKN